MGNELARLLELTQHKEKLLCEQSLAQFVKSAWHIIEPGTELIWNWHLDTICGYLMAFHNNELPDKRLIINIPPGTLKSILVSVMYPAWCWISSPSERYLTITNEQGLAIRDALRMKQIITSEWFQSKWPLKLQSSQNEKTLYANDKNGHRQSQGITASNTGKRGSVLIIDDPIDAKKSFSDTIRNSVNDTWDNSLSSRLNDFKKSGVLVIMQRVHESDLVGHLLKKVKSKWTVLSIPMEYEGVETFNAGFDIGKPELNDPRKEKGELLFPEKFPFDAVESLKEDLGTYGTCAQLQQRPAPLSGGLIERQWLEKTRFNNPPFDYIRIIQSWDTAQKPDQLTNDPSVCTTWKETSHGYYLIDVFVTWSKYPELKRAAKSKFKEFNPSLVLIEDKSSGSSLIQDLRIDDECKMPIVAIEPESDKKTRLYSVSGFFESGRVWLPESASWLLNYEAELFTFPMSTHDDQVDSTSQFLNYVKLKESFRTDGFMSARDSVRR